jgi:hypothetical protein
VLPDDRLLVSLLGRVQVATFEQRLPQRLMQFTIEWLKAEPRADFVELLRRVVDRSTYTPRKVIMQPRSAATKPAAVGCSGG